MPASTASTTAPDRTRSVKASDAASRSAIVLDARLPAAAEEVDVGTGDLAFSVHGDDVDVDVAPHRSVGERERVGVVAARDGEQRMQQGGGELRGAHDSAPSLRRRAVSCRKPE